ILDSIAPVLDLGEESYEGLVVLEEADSIEATHISSHARLKAADVVREELGADEDPLGSALEDAFSSVAAASGDLELIESEEFFEPESEPFDELEELIDDERISHFHIPPPDEDASLIEMSVDGLASVDGLGVLEDVAGVSAELLSLEDEESEVVEEIGLFEFSAAQEEALSNPAMPAFELESPPSTPSTPTGGRTPRSEDGQGAGGDSS